MILSIIVAETLGGYYALAAFEAASKFFYRCGVFAIFVVVVLVVLVILQKISANFQDVFDAFTRSSLETLKGSWLYVTLSEVILPNHGAVLRDRDASEMLANVTVSNASSEFSIADIVHSHSSKRGQARRPTRNRISRISLPSSTIETAKHYSK